jgi:hypothetical protein
MKQKTTQKNPQEEDILNSKGEISEFKAKMGGDLEKNILSFIGDTHRYKLVPNLSVKQASGKIDYKATSLNINKYLQENEGSAFLWKENEKSERRAFLVKLKPEEENDIDLLTKRLKTHVSSKHRDSDLSRLLAASINIKFKSFVYDSYDHYGYSSAARIQILNHEKRLDGVASVEYSSIKIKVFINNGFLDINFNPTSKLSRWKCDGRSPIVIDKEAIPGIDIVSIKTSELGDRLYKKNGYNPDIKKNPYIEVMDPVNLNLSYFKALFGFKNKDKNENLKYAGVQDFEDAFVENNEDFSDTVRALIKSGFEKNSILSDADYITKVNKKNNDNIKRIRHSRLYQVNMIQEAVFEFIENVICSSESFRPTSYIVSNATSKIITEEEFYEEKDVFYKNMFVFSNNLAGRVDVLEEIAGGFPSPREFKYIDRDNLDKMIAGSNFNYTTLSEKLEKVCVFDNNCQYSILMISDYNEKYESIISNRSPKEEDLKDFIKNDLKFIYKNKIENIQNISMQNVQKDEKGFNNKLKPTNKSAYKNALNQLMWKNKSKGNGLKLSLDIKDGSVITLEYYETLDARNKRNFIIEYSSKSKVKYKTKFKYENNFLKIISSKNKVLNEDRERENYKAGTVLFYVDNEEIISIEKVDSFNLISTFSNIKKLKSEQEIKTVEEYFTGRDLNSKAYNVRPKHNILGRATSKKAPFIRKATYEDGEVMYYMPKPTGFETKETKQRKFIKYTNFNNPEIPVSEGTIDLINSLYILDVIKLGDNSRSTILEHLLKCRFDL